MPVVSMMRIEGNPEELVSKLRNVTEVGRRLAPKHGGMLNILARTDTGVIVVNLWETEEGRHAMAEEPEVQQALQSSGLPRPAFEGYEVVHVQTTDLFKETEA
jgi:hypothetical protein